MSLTIVEYPNNAATWSYWSAVHNGVIFKFRRQDVALTGIALEDIGGGVYKAVVRYTTPQIPIAAGDYVFIESGDNIGIYEVYITEPGPLSNYVVLTTDDITTSVGGFMNSDTLRENYYIETEVYRYEDSIADYLQIGETIKITTSWDGYARLDLSEWLIGETKKIVIGRVEIKAALSLDQDDDFDYTAINVKDNNRYLKYNFKYRECYIGVDNDFSSFQTNDWFAVKAVKQLGDLYGGNMGEYIWAINTVISTITIQLIIGEFGTHVHVTTVGAHGMTSGDDIYVGGTVEYDGYWVVDTIVSPIEFTFLMTSAPSAGILGGYVQLVILNKAKWLTYSTLPEYIEGYPFSLSFIWPEGRVSEFKKIEELIDINGNVLEHNEYALDTSQNEGVNHLTLQDGYSSDVAFVDVWLETGVVVIAHYVEDDYVEDDYVV